MASNIHLVHAPNCPWYYHPHLRQYVNRDSFSGHIPDALVPPDCIIVLTFQWLLIHRGQLREALQESGSAMSIMQFLRLLALALILASYGLGFSIYQLRMSAGQLQAWISRDNVHSGFSQIGQAPAVLIPEDMKQVMWTFWSIYPSSAFLFFILFGLNSEAKRDWEYMSNWAKTSNKICHHA